MDFPRDMSSMAVEQSSSKVLRVGVEDIHQVNLLRRRQIEQHSWTTPRCGSRAVYSEVLNHLESLPGGMRLF